jgi:large subunit ribosomal protein L23
MAAYGAGDGGAVKTQSLTGRLIMKDARDIIVAPIISEKSHRDLASGKYYFKVAKDSSKTDIEKAVETLFKVNVEKVNVVNVGGHEKSMGRFHGFAPDWKKAIVTIRKGQKIQGFFEGM